MLPGPLSAIGAALCVAALAAACGGQNDAGQAGGAPSLGAALVVATTTVLADVAQSALCDGVTVETLLSPGQDPHSIELSSRKAADLRSADLVLANGLELEEGFTDVLLDTRDAGTRVLFVGERLDPLPAGTDGAFDPHVWMDPLRMIGAVGLIVQELEAATGVDHSACASGYIAELERLDRRVASLLAQLPADARRLVTNHDSLGYFAERYAFEVVGTVIPGGATLAEPSARDLVDLIDAIERARVPAIFSDASASAALARIVAEETEPSVEVVTLFTGSLGAPGSGAETYLGLISTNAERISNALKRVG